DGHVTGVQTCALPIWDNLRVCFRNGPHKERRVLACRTCQKRFSERKGTPLYRCKLSEAKALSVLQHLQESCGVRQTGRLVGVHKIGRASCREGGERRG